MMKRLVKSKFLNEKPTQSIAAAAFIISLAGIASRILGLFRDRILAGQFGAGDTLDAYYAAFRIPDLIYNLMIVGALSAAFIPIFTEYIADKKEEDAWRFSSGMLSLQIFFMGTVSLILIAVAPWMMKIITPGFSGEKMDLTVQLTRIMFLSPLLLGISGIYGGILVSFKKFLIYSLAPIFYNVGIIIGVVFFVKFWGPVGLAWGVVLGALFHMLLQYPSVKFSGFSFKPLFFDALKNTGVRKAFKLMIPRTMTVAVTQINFTIITIFASTLAAGSLAVFNFANNIQSAPIGLFGISFSIAVFPALSAYAAKKEKMEFIKAFSRTFRQILFFVIPLSVFIFVLRAQTVRVLLGSGKFDWDDTILTFQTLGLLVASLFAQAVLPLLTRAFYALQDTKTPFYIALLSEVVNIVLVIALIGHFGVLGLAIAFSFASILNMALLLIFLKRNLPDIDGKIILGSTAKIVAASVIGGAVAQVAKYVVGSRGELDTFVAVFTQLVVAGLAGAMAFAIASYYFKIKEFFQFTESVTKKLFKAKKVIQEDTGEVTGI
ncbi:MAG TPA: murein biosynthesis integral membrane protein MurJ [Candidatus Moranbacteria bacterium]|jgi:putative peptidoglycan lipid II flippase|nr:murein biosynthesis integral membrane protein MurJ [Candidatus Moranbacteria bacterium]HPX94119.1 murein biosynthesis integral membrane protein MurJ [Candidatus Moranbacteria bacterium]HQB59179.1 murein biosynthesis integral membrane protein MurJ [Candidatus Moranbacteria bacterium]